MLIYDDWIHAYPGKLLKTSNFIERVIIKIGIYKDYIDLDS